jgi:hypothetical protein
MPTRACVSPHLHVYVPLVEVTGLNGGNDDAAAPALLSHVPIALRRCNRISVVRSDLVYFNLNGPDGPYTRVCP